jgi:hypothetical protein
MFTLLGQRKRAKLQWLQDLSRMNRGNVKSVKSEANRHFRNKKREYQKDKTNEVATNSKNKNMRHLY